MKKFTLTFAILCACCALAYTGTERYSGKDKEVMQQAPPSCEWYRAHEWDLDLWGTYAFSGNTGRADTDELDANFLGDPEPVSGTTLSVDIGQVGNDRFINRDGAWGGGADIKYFFSKYWALGGEGFVVDANDNSGGAGLFTFTFRWPIGCSRFAPYGFAGVGALGGGSHTVRLFNEAHNGPGEAGEEEEVEFTSNETRQNKHAEAIGQFGAGLEIRVTRHVGVMSDFAWNLVSGPDNNFGLARFGVTLSY
jgi:hypothetical protein